MRIIIYENLVVVVVVDGATAEEDEVVLVVVAVVDGATAEEDGVVLVDVTVVVDGAAEFKEEDEVVVEDGTTDVV